MTRLTRWGHSCVRLDASPGSLAIDPGSLSDLDRALDGVLAILVTHEHLDHVAPEPVAAAVARGALLWGTRGVVDAVLSAGAPADRLHVVAPGDMIEAAGFQIRVLGDRHAVIHPDIPRIDNVAFLVEGVLHPGDALVVPDEPVDVLLAPIGGPWLRVGDAVDYVRAVAPTRVVAIHDGAYSETGRNLALGLVGRLGGAGDVVFLGPGEGLDVGAVGN